MFSPARTKLVFLLMEPAFLPPSRVIISLYSSRLWCENVPEITIVLPSSAVPVGANLALSTCMVTPAFVSASIFSMFCGSRRKV